MAAPGGGGNGPSPPHGGRRRRSRRSRVHGLFLFLGLVGRAALLIGILYGFLWEELVPLLPRSAPRLTLVFYLRNFLSTELTRGPFPGYPAPFTATGSVLVPIALAAVFVVLGSLAFQYIRDAPRARVGVEPLRKCSV